jgi:hypothetical protein
MTGAKIQRDPSDQPERLEPKQSAQNVLQRHQNVPEAPVQSGKPSARARKPLFGS